MNAAQPIAADAKTLARRLISRQVVERWPAKLLARAWRVLAPVACGEQTEYRELTDATAETSVPTGLGRGLPRLSPKAAWFPRTEPILQLRRNGRQWSIDDPPVDFPQLVVFGARPCDAAAPDILAPLFGWDFHDVFFEKRIQNLAFIVLACSTSADNACFCASVGVDPAGQDHGDIVLTELSPDQYVAEVRTEAGQRLFAVLSDEEHTEAPAHFPAVDSIRDQARRAVAERFKPEHVLEGLRRRFNDPLWQRAARSCLACGTCAFACPTCHCFDIQDELTGSTGLRQKNWDACAFPLFTLHTSGHNPRPDQPSRWRQRLSHKFRYYPERFGRVLCTGCGRCIRLCPAGMDLLADLQELARDDGDSDAETSSAPGGTACLQAVSSASPTTGCKQPVPPKPREIVAPETRIPNPETRPENIYRPYLMKVAALRDETPDVRTLRLEFLDAKDADSFTFRVGQFGLYSALGEGESTFCIASSSTRKGYLECTFRQAGRVTRALRRLNAGDVMGFRGPYGNSFPVESWKGKDLLFVAGGIALPPMRSVIQYCLDNRADYGDITIVYGARTWTDHVYKDELAEWEKRPDVNLWLCIDWKMGEAGPVEAPAQDGWQPINLKDPAATRLDFSHRRYTAFVPQLVEAAKPSSAGRIAVVCGPPIMIKFTLTSLKKLGFNSENVFTTLENRMKCGLGKCGRCNVGPIYICKDGPVFTALQVELLPPEM